MDRPPIQGEYFSTVAELMEALRKVPPDTPIHQRGNVGNFPAGSNFVLLDLAEHKSEAGYYGAVEVDPVWRNPKQKRYFHPSFKAVVFR